MILVEGLLDLPIAYLVIAPAMSAFDVALEESSRVCGGGQNQTLSYEKIGRGLIAKSRKWEYARNGWAHRPSGARLHEVIRGVNDLSNDQAMITDCVGCPCAFADKGVVR
jgi:hypothetical protein